MTAGPSSISARPPAAAPLSRWDPWIQPQRIFLVFGLIFGLGLCALTAPFQVPDEQAHFYRAYQISEGRLLPVFRDRHGGADLPQSLANVAARFEHVHAPRAMISPTAHAREAVLSTVPSPATPGEGRGEGLLDRQKVTRANPLPEDGSDKVSWAEIHTALGVPLEPEKRQFTRTLASLYSPASYVPQAAAIFIGRHAGLGPLGLMYLGRISNLLCWLALNYLALRIAPACQRPLLLLLLMPMTLFEAASLSADPTTISLGVLFTAMVLRYIRMGGPASVETNTTSHTAEFQRHGQDAHATAGRIGLGAGIGFLVMAAMLALAKFVYLPLLALVFLIPPARLGGRRRYAVAVGCLGAVGLAAFLAWTAATHRADTVLLDNPAINPAEQVHLLRTHPFKVVTLMASTIQNKGWPIARSFVGRLGWLDTPMDHRFNDGYLLALFAACWFQERRLSFPRRWLIPIVLVPVALSVLAVTLLTYVYVNPVGRPFTSGVQGRYLIPLAPAVILLLWGLAPRWPEVLSRISSAILNLGAAAIVAFSGVYTLIVVSLRYYGHH